MTIDRHLWALTLKVERERGNDAPRYITEMISEAAVAGNQMEIDLWKAVAARLDQLHTKSASR